ncbi:MAG: hypothetical protein AAB036_00535 [Elusimicrobiota bacterium]
MTVPLSTLATASRPSPTPNARMKSPTATLLEIPRIMRHVGAKTDSPRAAAAEGETPSSSAYPVENLPELFDGSARSSADGMPLDPENLKIFVVRHGQPMTEISLSEAASLNGQFRLLTAKGDPSGLSEVHTTKIAALLRHGGLEKNIDQESLAVDWHPQTPPSEAPTEQAPAPPSFDFTPSRLLGEVKFLAKLFSDSLVKPLPSEILGGLATKSFPLVTAIGVYWAAIGLSHPIALIGLIGLSSLQQIFHGFFLKSWNNFQEGLVKSRGFNYQMFFNLGYVQGSGSLYRLLTWSTDPTSVTPPWSIEYLKDITVTSIFGTFFGVLGYNSLNALYAKGSIKRWQQSGIQQLRDLFFLLAGPVFATGSMTAYWLIFCLQQSLDLAIAIWSGKAKAQTIVFIASAALAGSAEFKAKYPAEGIAAPPPLKHAVEALANNPIVLILTWPVRALWKRLRGGKK